MEAVEVKTDLQEGGTAAGFLIPVTGFKAGVVTDMKNVPHEPIWQQAISPLKFRLWEFKNSRSWVCREGWDVERLLARRPGRVAEGSAFPSWNGNSVLTAHVYRFNGQPVPLINLINIKYGDRVIVHAFGQKYTFVVQTSMSVVPTDRSVMKHEEKPWLTLVTCRDYDEKTDTYLLERWCGQR